MFPRLPRPLNGGRAAAIGSAALLLVVLAGCSPTTGSAAPATTSASPSATATPTADSPSAAPVAAPTPLMNFGCDAFADAVSAEPAVLSTDVEEVDPAVARFGSHFGIPPAYDLATLGGLTCQWSDKNVSTSATDAGVAGYVAATIQVFPDAADHWADFVERDYFAETQETFCNDDAYATCHLEQLVNGYWVTIDLRGMEPVEDATNEALVAAAEPFIETVTSVIEASPTPGPRWSPPADTLEMPVDCLDGFISAEQAAVALGTDDTVVVGMEGGGAFPLENAVRDELGLGDFTYSAAYPCSLMPSDSPDDSVGIISWLPGGAWAARDALANLASPAEPTAIDLEGLEGDDEAFIRTDNDSDAIDIDIVIGGNWVEVNIDVPSSVSSTTVNPDRTAAATAVAEQIIANLYASQAS